MNYIPSINIEMNTASDFQYIVTENARLVAGAIVNGFNSGQHSFSIIGTYGTGKSSFLLALEDDLKKRSGRLLLPEVLGDVTDFRFINVVGDYASLSSLLDSKLNVATDTSLEALDILYQQLHRQNSFLIIAIDEFGKILEHASNTNPEKELYFIQKLAEFVNVPNRRIILLTTLHQNFGGYSLKLTENQRNEWLKVKGRFQEIVFAEPVEQLLTLTVERLGYRPRIASDREHSLRMLYDLARERKIVSENINYNIVKSLYPLDPISAVCLTMAIQRYGQNERSLFSFLLSKGNLSLNEFKEMAGSTYNLATVHDYLTYHFYSSIIEANVDSMSWRALNVAVERLEGSNLEDQKITDCLKLIKSIGLLNMFFKGLRLDDYFLIIYGETALGLSKVKSLIDILTSLQIIRFAKYKNQYILFEGTNIDIESELYKAASIVPAPLLSITEIAPFIEQKVAVASAAYYRAGTPRYFEYRLSNRPEIIEPTGDIDGYIHLVVPLEDIEEEVIKISASSSAGASIYGYFRNTEIMAKHLYEIYKLNYIIENVAFDDRVAKVELENQKKFETIKLNDVINGSLIKGSNDITWYFRGEKILVNSYRELNKLLSYVCNTVYYNTPIIRNELFNRQKLSSAISLARVNLLDAMLNHSDEPAFGIESFPPEKTIYFTLFKNSGIHRQDASGNWILGAPTSPDFIALWEASIKFLDSTVDKPGKLTDLVKILQSAPYKLKQGVIDFWIPIFLFIKQQDIALYNESVFVLSINKEVFELIQKRISAFSVKVLKVSGVKLDFFKRYRQFLKKNDTINVSSQSLIETVKPFFRFYRGLNKYARTTRKFDNAYTTRFRDVLSNAQDPAKTFFEDLPTAFGYKDFNDDDEFIEKYLDMIHRAVRDLNLCYDNLIDRIEEKIINHLGLPSDYSDYKQILEERYSSIDSQVLAPKTRAFLFRILSPSKSKREFIEKLSIIVNDRRLDELRDSEEPILIYQILHFLSELERQSALVDFVSDGQAVAFNFELASSHGEFSGSQTFRLPNRKSAEADVVEKKIESLLSEDEDLNIYVLLKILNKKLK